MVATQELLERSRLSHIADERVANLAHGQQRQLEIGMALAGAPRLILFDEPAAGLSPAERRELVALLRSMPAHMSFVLIEHDLDIALKVVERVTVMHNGRVLRHGTPDEIENDAEVQAIYMGRQSTESACHKIGPRRSWCSSRNTDRAPQGSRPPGRPPYTSAGACPTPAFLARPDTCGPLKMALFARNREDTKRPAGPILCREPRRLLRPRHALQA